VGFRGCRGFLVGFSVATSTPAAPSRSSSTAAFAKAVPISSSVIRAGADAIGGAELVDFGFLGMGHLDDMRSAPIVPQKGRKEQESSLWC
jgi:hypothetical protein